MVINRVRGIGVTDLNISQKCSSKTSRHDDRDDHPTGGAVTLSPIENHAGGAIAVDFTMTPEHRLLAFFANFGAAIAFDDFEFELGQDINEDEALTH